MLLNVMGGWGVAAGDIGSAEGKSEGNVRLTGEMTIGVSRSVDVDLGVCCRCDVSLSVHIRA